MNEQTKALLTLTWDDVNITISYSEVRASTRKLCIIKIPRSHYIKHNDIQHIDADHKGPICDT